MSTISFENKQRSCVGLGIFDSWVRDLGIEVAFVLKETFGYRTMSNTLNPTWGRERVPNTIEGALKMFDQGLKYFESHRRALYHKVRKYRDDY